MWENVVIFGDSVGEKFLLKKILILMEVRIFVECTGNCVWYYELDSTSVPHSHPFTSSLTEVFFPKPCIYIFDEQNFISFRELSIESCTTVEVEPELQQQEPSMRCRRACIFHNVWKSLRKVKARRA